MELRIDEIVFRDDLYPRIETDPITVQKYAEDLSVLPPIDINQHNELIDGWHRWTAYKKVKVDIIPVNVIETISDAHLLELAIEKNSIHGLQLSQDDKQSMARKIYHVTVLSERDEKKKHLAKILSVSERTIRDWLSRIDKDSKEERDKNIFNLWLSCHTQQEIADECGCSQGEVAKSIPNGNLAEWNKSAVSVADHQTGFDIPIYNIWKKQKKTKGVKHKGNTDPMIVDRLLYLYTKPLDIVVDPFAGGGSTIDICKKRYRRYYVSDLTPIPEREKDIRQFDITEGLPKIARWKDVKLVYLDPPYWKQSEGKYSDLPNDLSNMPLDEFTSTLLKLIHAFSKKLSPGSYIALIIQPTQWKAPNRQYTDHVVDIVKTVKLPIHIRISCPYESQQGNAQMVDWARDNKELLVLTRELVIWRVI